MRPVAEPWPARTAQKPAPHSSLHSPSAGPLLCEDGRTASPAPARSSTAGALPRRPDRPAQVLGATTPSHTPHWRALHDDRPGFPIGTAPRVRRRSTHGLQRQNLQRPGIISQEKESVVLLPGPLESLLHHASCLSSLCSIHRFVSRQLSRGRLSVRRSNGGGLCLLCEASVGLRSLQKALTKPLVLL